MRKGAMTENEARYIVRMIQSFQDNILFLDATDKDDEELDRMKARYNEAGGWGKGVETALAEFILRVDRNGVPGGEHLQKKWNEGEYPHMDLYLQQRGIPRIERTPRDTAVTQIVSSER